MSEHPERAAARKPTRWGGRTPGGINPEQRRRDRIARAACNLHHRLRALAWWRGVISLCPGGVVTIPTAARIVGVSRTRIRELIAEGRIPAFQMPGGTANDKYVPVDGLMGVPTLMETGRPGAWCRGREYLDAIGYGINPWAHVTGRPTRRIPAKEIRQILKNNCESVTPCE